MRKWTSVTPVIAAYALSAAVYTRLGPTARPDFSPLLPFHVSAEGDMPRAAAAFLIPTIALVVWAFLSMAARVRGPVKGLPEWWINENVGSASISRFEPTFGTILFAVTSLLALSHLVVIAAYLGWPSYIYQLATAILGAGIIAAGNVMPRVKPNWIVGLRTKKTLSDPGAWARTHRLLGALMIAAGATVILLSIVAPRYALPGAFVAMLISFVLAYIRGTKLLTALDV